VNNPGGVLLSHRVSPAVPSALEGLTSVFGMGTGVAPPAKPPETFSSAVQAALPLMRSANIAVRTDSLSNQSICLSGKQAISKNQPWPRPRKARLHAIEPDGPSFERKIKVAKPHDRLVLVSSAPCDASTPSLSTSWSTRGL
jgi:hypothetical protein